MTTRTALRICPLCEATCGLALTIEGEGPDGVVTGARGDRDDVFSAGFVCPKGAAFGSLDADPDRLTAPLVRRDGELREASWAQAFQAVADGLGTGKEGVALVLGNPNVHTVAGALYVPLLARALTNRALFSASTVDQMPKQVACGYLYGDPLAFPVPDLDRTDHLLIVGANPLVSNGSLTTAPDFPGRLKALRARGGRLTVIDPKRTRTARLADRHIAPRPGTDAALLLAMAHVLLAEGLATPVESVAGLDEVRDLLAPLTPEAVAAHCDVEAGTVRELARELAAAPTAAVYGRMGSTTVEFGTLTSWAVDLLTILTGNLDRPGGALFPRSATATVRPPGPGRGFRIGRWHSRVSGHPEVMSELPLAALAEELDTPGEGRLRYVITVAANPVLSAPDGERLERALADCAFMVSVDPYLNETTRHADVVLPPPRPTQSAHFDFAFNALAVRHNVRYSRPAVPLPAGRPDECAILTRLALIAGGAPPDTDPAALDALAVDFLLRRAVAQPHSPVHGQDPAALATRLTGADGAERRLDLMLRLGPYGEGFGADPDGLSLAALLAHPHGIDLGPLRPRLAEVLKTPSGLIELCPEPIAADLPRLLASLDRRPGELVLIGRRHLRSNNSWMHNVPELSGGTNRCTLQVHPRDAERLGLTDGAAARIKGDGGEITAEVELTGELRPGVVSLPHGWGHDRPGTRTSVAAAHPGANVNQLLDGSRLDPLSGTAVLNGFPVQVSPAEAP
ncbi:molybdopterin oxidoreductase family protein [Streptomyces polyrhachis]|uniref:Molybdopterin oxidoreductase family protein n=1 Tax=Streptomyces polyrhachis TaxID=1282885 RepID=A0ABW2GJY5_9ACTN